MTHADILREQLREVAERRAARDEAAARAKAIRAQIEADFAELFDDAKELFDDAKRTALLCAEAEDVAKALGLAIYETDPAKGKQPAEGLAIKVGKLYTYDKAKALAWAQDTKMALIPESLDVAAFEKIAKATPLPFVTVKDDPAAQLSKDLTAYLAAAPVPASDPF